MVEKAVVAMVVSAERMLLDPAVRANRVEVELLLDEAFIEIAQSGRV